MPESRSRKKATFTPPQAKSAGPKINPPWFVPVMVGLMVLGLAWIVVTYLSQSKYPIPGIHQANKDRGESPAFFLADYARLPWSERNIVFWGSADELPRPTAREIK